MTTLGSSTSSVELPRRIVAPTSASAPITVDAVEGRRWAETQYHER